MLAINKIKCGSVIKSIYSDNEIRLILSVTENNGISFTVVYLSNKHGFRINKVRMYRYDWTECIDM